MTTASRVPATLIAPAVALLVGILVIAYGWFHPSKAGLYAGLFLTAGGVLNWVVRSVAHPTDRR
jgi:hypothetical protein